MPPNRNKKNYRLADMSISPDDAVPYPNPDENSEIFEDRIDMAEFGTILHMREWRGYDDTIEQFALMLNITRTHSAYSRCKELKGDTPSFTQVRRTDTWHSSVHSHQYFIDCTDCDRQVHNHLVGGAEEKESRRIVNQSFKEHYYGMLYDPYHYLDRWEAGKP